MSDRLKWMPIFVMLLAGAVTGIMTLYSGFEGKTALLILLAVLLFFYIIGCILQKMIFSFEQENEKKRLEEEAKKEEGKVLEKDMQEAEQGDLNPQEQGTQDKTAQQNAAE